jgi:hypothetical protein
MVLVIAVVLFCVGDLHADKPFWGNLKVGSDKENAILPVFIDGEYKGNTPFSIDSLPVGNYSISFISNTLKDSLINGTAGYKHLSDGLKKIFGKDSDLKKRVSRSIAELAEQRVVIQYQKTTEIVFPITEIEKQAASYGNKAMRFVIAGAGIIVAFGIFLVVLL